jgi:hypothetical protein
MFILVSKIERILNLAVVTHKYIYVCIGVLCYHHVKCNFVSCVNEILEQIYYMSIIK